MATNQSGYSLAHPVYLDVPMMVSFLAHLEGGVSVSESETRTETGINERLSKARAGFRAKVWGVADLDVGGDKYTQRRDEATSESKTDRHHTAASLFNVLYDYLREDEQIVELDNSDQLTDLRSGQLVELSGEYLGNSIEDVLALFKAFYPYMAPDEAPAPEPTRAHGSRSGNPAKRAAAKNASQPEQASSSADGDTDNTGLKMLLRMGQDITEAPVHDLLFRTESGLNAVVTVASDYYSPTTHEYLRAGEFRIVGKVSRVIRNDNIINLTRRTVLGAAGPDMAKSIIEMFNSIDELSFDVVDPIITAPAVQILPMAIFI